MIILLLLLLQPPPYKMIQFNSYLFMHKLNSTNVNYRAIMREGKKPHANKRQKEENLYNN
jgi:hypothetical protein